MRTLTAILLTSLLISCENADLSIPEADGYRACFSSTFIQNNSLLEIWQYRYNGQIVYLTVADCCDRYNYLYDSNCKLICAPSGGFSGQGDGKCTDFADKAKDGVLVWKKD
jgi:hypothetical protein